jgi:hypothetical protein
MNISWVLSNSAQIDPGIDIAQMKELGSFWGGWQTWRSCQTDNVICHDMVKSRELIDRSFHQTCNFYVPNKYYISLGRPDKVKVYDGDFVHDLYNHEDIVAMHLAASTSDIVLLLGFDFGEFVKSEDRIAEHCAHNYRSLTRQVIQDCPNVQWVCIDHPKEFRPDLISLPNLGRDTLTNILSI